MTVADTDLYKLFGVKRPLSKRTRALYVVGLAVAPWALIIGTAALLLS
jgi:hypothetical protein